MGFYSINTISIGFCYPTPHDIEWDNHSGLGVWMAHVLNHVAIAVLQVFEFARLPTWPKFFKSNTHFL